MVNVVGIDPSPQASATPPCPRLRPLGTLPWYPQLQEWRQFNNGVSMSIDFMQVPHHLQATAHHQIHAPQATWGQPAFPMLATGLRAATASRVAAAAYEGPPTMTPLTSQVPQRLPGEATMGMVGGFMMGTAPSTAAGTTSSSTKKTSLQCRACAFSTPRRDRLVHHLLKHHSNMSQEQLHELARAS